MQEAATLQSVHPLGESDLGQLGEPWPVDTPGGRYYAEIDQEAPVTREGQLIFFAQFLHVGGRWEHFVKRTPLRYKGNRGSRVVDVLGTATLSILCGHWRYAHINAVRGDTINPALLDMRRTMSKDVVRRAIKRMDEGRALAWPPRAAHTLAAALPCHSSTRFWTRTTPFPSPPSLARGLAR